MKVIKDIMKNTTINQLRKVAYGGDLGDGIYHDWSYLVSYDENRSKRYNKDSLQSVHHLASDIRQGRLSDYLDNDDGTRTKIKEITLSKYPYGFNEDTGLTDTISTKDWLKMYDSAKSDKDRLKLADYLFMQYISDKYNPPEGEDESSIGNSAINIPWWLPFAVGGVLAIPTIGMYYGIDKLYKYLDRRL